MQYLNDRSQVGPPGLCLVCETAPQAGVVDTLQNYTPGFPSSLAGGKYLCEGCVKAAAEVVGLVPAEAANKAQYAQQVAEAKLTAVTAFVKQFTDQVTGGVLEDVAASAQVVTADNAETIVQVEGYEVAPPQQTDAQSETPLNAVSVPAAQVAEVPAKKAKAKADVQDA